MTWTFKYEIILAHEELQNPGKLTAFTKPKGNTQTMPE